ncbi:MAG: hypothetical protein WCD18_07475 [Thermosynechococcaceae cyanobacterium]
MRPLHDLRFSSSMGRAVLLPLLILSTLEIAALPLRANPKPTPGSVAVPSQKLSATPRIAQATGQPVKTPPPPPPGNAGAPAEEPPAEEPPAEEPPAEDTGAEEGSTSGQLIPPTASPDEMITIPKSSAIVVSFPAEITLDPKRKHDVPITLTLIQPIVDSEGQIVAPAKSLATAKMKAMKGGDLIEVVSVVVGGRVIPINAIGTLVPAQNKPEDVANPVVGSPGLLNNTLLALQQSSAISNRVLSGFGVGRNRPFSAYEAIDLGLAIGVGLTQPVPVIPPAFVNIAQNTVYILTLASPVTIQKRLVETGLQIIEKSTDVTAQ